MDSNMLKQIYYTLINFSLFELRYHCLGLYQQYQISLSPSVQTEQTSPRYFLYTS